MVYVCLFVTFSCRGLVCVSDMPGCVTPPLPPPLCAAPLQGLFVPVLPTASSGVVGMSTALSTALTTPVPGATSGVHC